MKQSEDNFYYAKKGALYIVYEITDTGIDFCPTEIRNFFSEEFAKLHCEALNNPHPFCNHESKTKYRDGIVVCDNCKQITNRQ